MRYVRGAVVVETALTVGIGLMILMFSIQVGVLGFLQITADAASFETARNQGLGLGSTAIGLGTTSIDSNGAADFTHQQFPEVATADISIASPSPAPTATLGLNYEYNVGVTTNGQRHSGETMLQPLQLPTTVKPHGMFSLLGKLIGVGAQDVEPEWAECSPHFNSAQLALPQFQCGTASNPSLNYFTSGENTPMYFVGFNFARQCTLPLPWTSCSYSNTQYLSMGSAEYLDTDNWGAANPGVSGSFNGYASSNSNKGVTPTTTFENMGCHTNRIADIAFFFQHYPDLPSVYSGLNNGAGGGYELPLAVWLSTKPTSFQTMNSFYIPPSQGQDPGLDQDIRQVYAWDVTLPAGTMINSSEPGTNMTYQPDQGYGCF